MKNSIKSVISIFCCVLILAASIIIGYTQAYAINIGDVNKSGTVNSVDALYVLQYAVGSRKSLDAIYADVNADGTINSYDALKILQISTGLKTTYDVSGPYKVVRVVDGDTFVADIDGTETKIRLIGVDTPESVATGANAYKNCEEGRIASSFTKETLTDKNIYIEYDVGSTDTYGRTLAYVYLENGQMFNKLLLEKGYAKTMTIQPNVKYADEFVQIQQKAANNETGFWEDYFKGR